MRSGWLVVGVVARVAAAQPAQVAQATQAALAPRTVTVSRLHGAAPTIDGRLDDAAWRDAAIVTDFVQTRPRPGAAATFRTEAYVTFDDAALYVAVRLFDPHPDSIVAPYPRRDDETTSDWTFVEIDSRHDHRTATSLGVNPRGVQVDGMFQNDVDYDAAWNAVWTSAARIDSLGWVAEYRIPFSQLALGGRGDNKGDTRTFGLNVYRYVTRLGESSNWSPRLPTQTGVVSHFNEMHGVVVPAGVRGLELVPYAAARAAHAPALTGDLASAALPHGGRALAGLDARLRITPGLTVTATVHPDFGQVEADPSEVNLTTFETYFAEQRPFFTEGADVFRFNGSAGLGLPFHSRGRAFDAESPFYSRRIGRVARGEVPSDTRVLDATTAAPVLGAFKVTGRTDGGWTLGALGAVTGEATARVVGASASSPSDVVLEPRAADVALRASRDFRGGLSAVGGMLTIVTRPGMDVTNADGLTPLGSVLARDAVLAGIDGRHRVAGGAIELSGFASASRVTGTPAAIRLIERAPEHDLLRPDASYLRTFRDDSLRTSLNGLAAQARIAKPSGHWQWSVVGHTVSPAFEANDVGFQRHADWLLATGTLVYHEFRPGPVFRNWSLGVDEIGAGWSFGGERRAAVASFSASGTLRNEWGGTLSLGRELSVLSTERLRGGPALREPGRVTWLASLHTDTRRRAQLTVNGNGWREPAPRSYGTSLGAQLDTRLTDRVAIGLGPNVSDLSDAWQYVGTAPAAGASWVVGRLRQRTASLVTRADVAVASRLTIQLYAQPLIGAAAYSDFASVVAPRASDPAARVQPVALSSTALADPSFGARSAIANAVLRWEYRPGSTLFVVWSEQRDGALADARWRTAAVHDLSRLPATDVLLVKWTYWWAK